MYRAIKPACALWGSSSPTALMIMYLDVAASVGPGNAGANGGTASPHVERLAGAPPRSLHGVVPALRVGVLPAAVGVALAQVPAALILPARNAYRDAVNGLRKVARNFSQLFLNCFASSLALHRDHA